ncbi:MAG: hypothetical protein BJ554DRAFT_7820, partial [Olpidium bornovanus]
MPDDLVGRRRLLVRLRGGFPAYGNLSQPAPRWRCGRYFLRALRRSAPQRRARALPHPNPRCRSSRARASWCRCSLASRRLLRVNARPAAPKPQAERKRKRRGWEAPADDVVYEKYAASGNFDAPLAPRRLFRPGVFVTGAVASGFSGPVLTLVPTKRTLSPAESIFACTPATVRGQPVQLGGDPKGKNILYTNGRTVVIRDIANPAIANEYTQHSAPATVARYSPSGYYIASGDASGNVRVWDTTQAENILKYETKVIAGQINDLCWDSESQRIIAVGDGKERWVNKGALQHNFSAFSLRSLAEPGNNHVRIRLQIINRPRNVPALGVLS